MILWGLVIGIGASADASATLYAPQCVPHHHRCSFHVGGGMRDRDKTGLELRRSEVNAILQAMMEEIRKFFGVAPPGRGQIVDWPGREKETEH